jgi:hypothetical protein
MRAAFAVLALAVAAAPVARAADGVVELSQACVAAGCVPSDAPGFPITLPSGSYKLTSNITVPDANTDAITTDNQTNIDLNGFAVSGVTSCTGAPAVCTNAGTGEGIYVGARSSVRNGIVRRMGSHGVQGGDGTHVDDMLIESNGGSGIRMSSGAKAWVIQDSRIMTNGDDGITSNFTGAGGNVISGCTVYGNKEAGLNGPKGTVVNSAIAFNGDYGLLVGSGVAIGNNAFSENNGGNANDQTNGGIETSGNACGTTLCQ